MPEIHKLIGLLVVATFGLTSVWGLYAVARKLDPGKVFWVLVAAVQVSVGLQVIAGVILLIFEGLPQIRLHLVYGSLAGGAMIYAQVEARRRPDRPWIPFVWAVCVAFLLSLRALQTGMGAS